MGRVPPHGAYGRQRTELGTKNCAAGNRSVKDDEVFRSKITGNCLKCGGGKRFWENSKQCSPIIQVCEGETYLYITRALGRVHIQALGWSLFCFLFRECLLDEWGEEAHLLKKKKKKNAEIPSTWDCCLYFYCRWWLVTAFLLFVLDWRITLSSILRWLTEAWGPSTRGHWACDTVLLFPFTRTALSLPAQQAGLAKNLPRELDLL